MSIKSRIIEHRFTTALGAISGVCAMVVPLVISGSVDRSDLYLALILAAVGGLLKDPGAQ